MGLPAQVIRSYDATRPLMESVRKYVRNTLGPWCEARHYPFIDRIKTVGSVAEKLESGRYRKWKRLDDLYACTVIVPTLLHEPGVVDHLRRVFVEVKTRARGDLPKSPREFRFDSSRFIGKLFPDAVTGHPLGAGELRFEVQVVTAFEYAWQTATRDFAYKTDNVSWGAERLAASLRSLVEQADLLIVQHAETARAIVECPDPVTETRRDIVLRLKRLSDERYLPESLRPASWTRLADNLLSLAVSSVGGEKAPQLAARMLEAFEDDLHRQSFDLAESGSLFQAIVGWGNQSSYADDVRSGFPLVPSEEYGLYGVNPGDVWGIIEMDAHGDVLTG